MSAIFADSTCLGQRFFMKLFKANNMETVRLYQEYFGIDIYPVFNCQTWTEIWKEILRWFMRTSQAER